MAANGNPPEPLNDRQEAMALALARGRGIKSAARELGIGARTAYRWAKENPAFARRVHDLRSDLLEVAAARLSGLSAEAAATLGRLLRSANDLVRLSAARAILEQSVRMRDAAEFEERLTDLEHRMSKPGEPPHGR